MADHPPPLPEGPYAELQITSNYSFLRGASRITELAATAALYGLDTIALTDRNSLAGIVAAHQRCREAGLRFIVGCRLDLADFPPVLVYPTDRDAYSRLCQLLSRGKARAGKGRCDLAWADLATSATGLLAILLPPRPADAALPGQLARFRAAFGSNAYLALTLLRRPGDMQHLHMLDALGRQADVTPVVTGDVLYHHPDRRMLQDVVTCIREGCTIDDAGFRRERSFDRHMKPPEEILRLYADFPDALAATREIARRCRFSLDELEYQYPDEIETPGLTPQQELERLVAEGVANRYAQNAPQTVLDQLAHELGLIAQLRYAPYFLTVNAIVREARRLGILCQGRGSAANSVVCYVLGITSVDPIENALLFERFVSTERPEPPDIDVDFEHDRREDIIQWVYERYGRERAALCATVIQFRSRGALREVGKVMGLSEDVTAALAGQVWGVSNEVIDDSNVDALNLNRADRRLRLTLQLAQELIGFPRHLSQHPGGFVLTRNRLDTLVPIEPAAMDDRQVIEWDKDDIDTLKFMKVDVLGLGMLGCMRRAFDLLDRHRGIRHDLASIPSDDTRTYEMISRADTLGTFQIESRAQMSMLPRMRPREFYDLAIQVAIVRPGPIQGDMVHPYLRRRQGIEKPDYVKPELEAVLKKTLGVPLFQEQAMRVAMVAAKFTAVEADQLRRSMATFKKTGGVGEFRNRLIEGMVANGYDQAFAERLYEQIKGFGSYGFPESHAISFARIAYASAWMKCHHPDVFCAALLNAQPMGFYAPAQIVRDAEAHGVEVRPICINASLWDCTLETAAAGPYLAVRLGLRMTKGVSGQTATTLIAARGTTPYRSIASLHHRTGLAPASLEPLARADAFHALGLGRRDALWAVRGLLSLEKPVQASPWAGLPLFATPSRAVQQDAALPDDMTVALPPLPRGGDVAADYRSLGLSLREHPLAVLRPLLTRRRLSPCSILGRSPDGRRVTVAGLVLLRQRPGSAKGTMFMTLEDETGIANVVVWSDLFDRQRSTILAGRMLACHGRVQVATPRVEGQTIHLVAERLENLTPLLRELDREDDLLPQAAEPLKIRTHDFG